MRIRAAIAVIVYILSAPFGEFRFPLRRAYKRVSAMTPADQIARNRVLKLIPSRPGRGGD